MLHVETYSHYVRRLKYTTPKCNWSMVLTLHCTDGLNSLYRGRNYLCWLGYHDTSDNHKYRVFIEELTCCYLVIDRMQNKKVWGRSNKK